MQTNSLVSSASPMPSMRAGEISLQQFSDHSEDVFWLADLRSGRLLYVSPRFEQVWGIGVEALIKEPTRWNDAVDPSDASMLPTPFFADSADTECAVREYRISDTQGQPHWIRDRRFYLRDSSGEMTRVGGIVEDVSERKQHDAQRDEFLSMVTHELRSPLNAMRGWTHVLRRAGTLNPLQEKALEAIDRSAQTQARLMDELLDNQRILLGDFQLQWERANLATLVDEAVASVQDQAQTKHIRINAQPDLAIGAISADPHRLRQAVVNLLSNAIKLTPEDGSIHVFTRQQGRKLLIEMQDSGSGLTPAELPAARLGLSLARQVITLHGGHIKVRNDGLGQGATVSIELPDGLRLPGAASRADLAAHA